MFRKSCSPFCTVGGWRLGSFLRVSIDMLESIRERKRSRFINFRELFQSERRCSWPESLPWIQRRSRVSVMLCQALVGLPSLLCSSLCPIQGPDGYVPIWVGGRQKKSCLHWKSSARTNNKPSILRTMLIVVATASSLTSSRLMHYPIEEQQQLIHWFTG